MTILIAGVIGFLVGAFAGARYVEAHDEAAYTKSAKSAHDNHGKS